MAYSRDDAYKTMQKIYGYKQDWVNADAAGDITKKNNAATKAQEYYKSLRDNGYGAQAQKLQDSGLDQSRKYIDNFYAMSGRSAIRPYFYGKAGQYGMTNDDVDKLLSFNDTTGEVSFNGRNVGKPAAISSDGVSYWNSGDLDNIWNDYVSSNGVTKPMSAIAKQGTQDLMGMNKQLFDTTMKDHDTINGTNPLDTAVGKAVMQKYGLMGYTGRQNALATGAASNGGNVDSYSAANAMRQQAALNSMGVDAALKAYDTQQQTAGARLDQARATLQQMGVNINDAVANNETMLNGEVDRSEKLAQGKFDREQTALNNEMNRYATQAGITGYVPEQLDYKDNPFFDINGNLINPDSNDYQAIINEAKAKLANTTDASEKRTLEETIRNAQQARVRKIFDNYAKYGQYAGSIETPARRQTEEGRQFDVQSADAKEIANMGYQHDMDMANLNADIADRQARTEAELQMQIDTNTTNNTIRANAAASSGSGSGSSIDADSVKITNKTNLEGKYDVGGGYLTAEQIIDGINNGTLYYEDEGNGKISIHVMAEGVVKAMSKAAQDAVNSVLRKSK